MEKRFLDLIEETRVLQYPYQLQPPAAAAAIEHLIAVCSKQLHYTPPPFYLALLQTTDGMACNGIQVYASKSQPIAGLETKDVILEGFVEANLLWRAGEEGAHNLDYFYFAESGDYLYCHCLPAAEFQIVDRVTLEPIYAPAVFATVEELFEQLLNHMLNRYGDGVEESQDNN